MGHMRPQLATGVLLTRGRRCRIRMSRTHRRNVWVCGPRVCQKGESTSQRRYSDGVVFQHVLVPLKQAGSFRAAGSALGHLPDAWRIDALPRQETREGPAFPIPMCFVLVSPVFVVDGLGVPGCPRSYASPYYFERFLTTCRQRNLQNLSGKEDVVFPMHYIQVICNIKRVEVGNR